MKICYLRAILIITLVCSCSLIDKKATRTPSGVKENILDKLRNVSLDYFEIKDIHLSATDKLNNSYDKSFNEFPLMIIFYDSSTWDQAKIKNIFTEGSKIFSQCGISFRREKIIFIEISQKLLFGDFWLQDLQKNMSNITKDINTQLGFSGIPFIFYFLGGTETFNRNSGGATAYENTAVMTPDRVFGDRIDHITFAHEVSHQLFNEVGHRFLPGNILSEHHIRGTKINSDQCRRSIGLLDNLKIGSFRPTPFVKKKCILNEYEGKFIWMSEDLADEYSFLTDLNQPTAGRPTGKKYLDEVIIRLRKHNLCE